MAVSVACPTNIHHTHQEQSLYGHPGIPSKCGKLLANWGHLTQSLRLGECHKLTEEDLNYLNCDKDDELYPNHSPATHTTLGDPF